MLTKTQYLTRLAILLALTLSLEMIGLPQPITGPLVNFFLIITTLVLGPPAGVGLGTITPLVAVIRGQLPAILAPMVPFIILANAILVLGFALVRAGLSVWEKPGKNSGLRLSAWIGVLAGAIFKFLWLAFAVRVMLPFLFNIQFPVKILAMMTTPQLLTALVGGSLALGVYAFLVRTRILLIPTPAKTHRKMAK